MGEQTQPQPTTPLLGFRSDALPALRRALRPLLLYELVLKIVGILLLGPLTAAVVNALIALTGESSVANDQLLAFGLSPLGISTILVWASILFATAFVERSGVAHILMRSLHGVPVSARQAVWLALHNSLAFVGIAFLQVLLFLLCAAPFVALAGLTYSLAFSGGDINFYLADRPPVFYLAAAIGSLLALGAAAVMAVLYVRWFFAVPVCLFERQRFARALRGSAALARGRSWHIFGAVLTWQVCRFLLGALFLFLLVLFNQGVVTLLGHHARGVLWFVAALLVFDMIAVQLAAGLDTVVLCLLATMLYENARRHARVSTPQPLLEPITAPTLHPLGQKAAVPCLIGLALILTVWHSAVLMRTFTAQKSVEVTAHRAGGHGVPENSLAALKKGIAAGADWAEIDVQETKDGVVVVVHDQDLRRLGGVEKSVAGLTLAELKRIDIGAKFDPEFRGEFVPTLEEFIDAAEGCIKLNIELKYYGRPGQSLARKVVQILHDKDFTTQAALTSLNHASLTQVRRLDPHIKTGFIVAVQLGDLTRLDVDFLSINKKLAKPELLARAAKHGLGVHVWTVDQRQEMLQMLHRGVDNLITDEPERAVEVVDWYFNLSDVERFLLRFRDWLRG